MPSIISFIQDLTNFCLLDYIDQYDQKTKMTGDALLDDMALVLRYIKRTTNITTDLDKRFSESELRPEFDPKIHVLPSWEEVSKETEDAELNWMKMKWNGELGGRSFGVRAGLDRWDWERVEGWGVDVGEALEAVCDEVDEKMSTIGPDIWNADNTDASEEHQHDTKDQQPPSKIDNKNKRKLQETDCNDEPVKRRHVLQGAHNFAQP